MMSKGIVAGIWSSSRELTSQFASRKSSSALGMVEGNFEISNLSPVTHLLQQGHTS